MLHFSPGDGRAARQALLRPPLPQDAALVGEAIASQPPHPFFQFARQAPQWIDQLVHRRCAAAHLLLIDSSEDRMLGMLSVAGPDGDGRVEVGYWLRSEARGQGLATQALRVVMGDLAAQRHVVAVSLRINEHNAASIRLARRCGFRLERRCAGMLRYVWEPCGSKEPC